MGGAIGASISTKALSKVSREQWIEALETDLSLFKCIDEKGDHNFKDAFQELAIRELNEGELSAHIWDKFPDIYNVLMDKDDVVKNLAVKYFQLEEDPMSDSAFQGFSSCIGSFIKDISLDNLMVRVEYWLVKSSWDRLSWVMGEEMEFDGEPKESLQSRVIDMLDSADSEKREILMLISDAFNIEIPPSDKKKDRDQDQGQDEDGDGIEGDGE